MSFWDFRSVFKWWASPTVGFSVCVQMVSKPNSLGFLVCVQMVSKPNSLGFLVCVQMVSKPNSGIFGLCSNGEQAQQFGIFGLCSNGEQAQQFGIFGLCSNGEQVHSHRQTGTVWCCWRPPAGRRPGGGWWDWQTGTMGCWMPAGHTSKHMHECTQAHTCMLTHMHEHMCMQS